MTIDKRPLTPSGTIRSDEVARFNRLAATWWNRNGPMRPLHVVNELRLSHVLEQIAERFGRPSVRCRVCASPTSVAAPG